jgi:hypothetical protein
MIDSTFRSLGEFIDYRILPEQKNVQLVSIKTKEIFDETLEKYDAKKVSVDFEKLKSDNDSSYLFSLARISLNTIYYLSNGLYAIDQLINDKANPYYMCETLEDFKLITKYLLVFRPEIDWDFEVKCLIHEHFGIKEFLEREKKHLKFIKEMSDDRYKLFVAEDGKCVYVSYWGNMKGRWHEQIIDFNQIGIKWYSDKELENENEFYWSLVIYESMEKLKLHNVDLRDK